MARPRGTVLDRFIDEFALMPADERRITLAQLSGIDRAAAAIAAKAAEKPAPPEQEQPE